MNENLSIALSSSPPTPPAHALRRHRQVTTGIYFHICLKLEGYQKTEIDIYPLWSSF